MNIYIGNFAEDVTEDNLRELFATYGNVESVKLIKDKFTGASRGFAFVEMPAKGEAQNAIDGIKDLKGRMVVVNEARPQTDSPRGGGRRDSRGGSSGGGFRRGGRY